MLRLTIAIVSGFFLSCAWAQASDTVASVPPTTLQSPVPKANIYYFKDLLGPTSITVVPKPEPTPYTTYKQSGNSSLAILLTNTDSDWLNLAHGLKSIGIPFIITRDYREALAHKVIYVYPSLSGLSSIALEALANFPHKGGTLIAQDIDSGSNSLSTTFGFTKAVATKDNEIHINTKFPVTAEFRTRRTVN